MKGKFLIFLTLLSFVTSLASAQNEKFLSRVASKPVTLDFEIMQEGVSGTIARGNLFYYCGNYFIKSDVYRIYCDTQYKYTVDDYAFEAVYEKVDSTSLDLFTNPSLIFTTLSSEVVFEFPSNSEVPDKASYRDPKSENVYIFYLSNVRFGETAPSDDEFRPAELGPKYVITDLR